MKNYQKFSILSIAFLMALAPAFSYAKVNGNGNGNGKARVEAGQSKVEVRTQTQSSVKGSEDQNVVETEDNVQVTASTTQSGSCIRAFGHLIAPGFIKNFGNVDFLRECLPLPFGISKKIGNQGTSTPDTIAPIISNVAVQTRINQALITWTTNEYADGRAYLSTTSPVVLGSARLVNSGQGYTTTHKVYVNGLTASTTYYFIVSSKDFSGNTGTSSQMSFTTKPLGADVTAPVISNISVSMGTTTANVSWSTNELSSSKVYFSTSTPLDITATSTGSVSSSTLTTTHSLGVAGLTASSTYYFAVESTDASGNTATSSSLTGITH